VAYLLHHLLTDAAAIDPSHEAVRGGGRSMSYGELNRASNGVAQALVAAGVQRGDRVAIYLPKSVEMVAAVYGALKAGAAYVPLDPRSPVRRVGVVAADCTVAAVVTTPGRAAPLLAALGEHRPDVVLLVEDGTEVDGILAAACSTYAEAVAGDPADPEVPAIDQDIAYILYTSGSTGVPKGVMLSHRNALTFVEWCAATIGVRGDDRFSNHAPLHFDLSVLDLYLAAAGGATVVLVPEDEAYLGAALVEFVNRERITVWYSVPSALTLMTRAVPDGTPATSFPTLRAVVFAGEVFPTKHLREFRALVPDVDLWNLYGPTETNVITYYRVGSVDDLPADDRTIPIGRPCRNTEVFALTAEGTVAGIGEEGELFARGSTVMKGYWGRRDRTAEVLVPDPLGRVLPDPCYRTGDLVRLRPDGDYDFLGRRDHQIKSRGYRIELGEVEAALNSHPSVAEAAAVAVAHEEWGSAIVAWVVPRAGEAVTVMSVKRHLVERIPRYMLPARVEILENGDLPRTSNGKIDRRRLTAEAAEAAEPGTAI